MSGSCARLRYPWMRPGLYSVRCVGGGIDAHAESTSAAAIATRPPPRPSAKEEGDICRKARIGFMRVGDRHYRSLWADQAPGAVHIIDQARLPHVFETRSI